MLYSVVFFIFKKQTDIGLLLVTVYQVKIWKVCVDQTLYPKYISLLVFQNNVSFQFCTFLVKSGIVLPSPVIQIQS